MKKTNYILILSFILFFVSCKEEQPTQVTSDKYSLSLYFWEDSNFEGDTVNYLKCSELFYSKANPEWVDDTNELPDPDIFFKTDTVNIFFLDTITSEEKFLFRLIGEYSVEFDKNTAVIKKLN